MQLVVVVFSQGVERARLLPVRRHDLFVRNTLFSAGGIWSLRWLSGMDGEVVVHPDDVSQLKVRQTEDGSFWLSLELIRSGVVRLGSYTFQFVTSL